MDGRVIFEGMEAKGNHPTTHGFSNSRKTWFPRRRSQGLFPKQAKSQLGVHGLRLLPFSG